jgi:hypothetical protein
METFYNLQVFANSQVCQLPGEYQLRHETESIDIAYDKYNRHRKYLKSAYNL